VSKAVKNLQKLLNTVCDTGLTVDGILGKKTSTAIEYCPFPSWVKTAMQEVGTKEAYGKEDNPRVVFYHSFSGGKYEHDQVPWCGSFLAYVFSANGIELPKTPERALSWVNFGKEVEEPKLGAVAVKNRLGGGGHVCLVVGKNPQGDLYCLGGNQRDEVNISLYPASAFITFRLPTVVGKGKPLPLLLLDAQARGKES